MNLFYDLIKAIAMLQVVLILLLLVTLYLVRLYFSLRQHHEKNEEANIAARLRTLLEDKTPLSRKDIASLTGDIGFVLSFLEETKKSPNQQNVYAHLQPLLSNKVLLPYARRKFNAWRWMKRYWSAWCFSFGFEKEDELRLKRLIQDKSNLVSLLASKIAFQSEHPQLIHTVIDTFAHGRRLQQSVYAEITVKKSQRVTQIILNHLARQTSQPTKMFSYKLLKWLPAPPEIPLCAKIDLKENSVDLTIAILQFIAAIDSPDKEQLLYDQARSPHWEVRAVCATLLKAFKTKQSYAYLEDMLSDSEWWVRINAAHALTHMGAKGIACLNNQEYSRDRFAYDAAKEALSQIECDNKT